MANDELIVKTCREFADLDNQLHGFLHGLDRQELVWTVEVDATGKDVGAGETLERQLRTVGTATDGLHLGGDAALLHGLQHEVDDMHLWVDLLLHGLVLVTDHTFHSAFAIAFVQLLGTALDEALAVLKPVTVMVADDIAQTGLFDTRRDVQQVVEA